MAKTPQAEPEWDYTVVGIKKETQRFNWVLVNCRESEALSCSACGWNIAIGPYYRHRAEGVSCHCQACHRVGHDWARAGDSEKQ